MKTCKVCGETKPNRQMRLDEHLCRVCAGRIRRSTGKQRAQRGRRIDRLREMVTALKNGPCMDCGGEFHFSAMHFDHRPHEVKTDGISEMVWRALAWPRIEKEISKCDLVCANCHAVRTYTRLHAGELLD